MQITIVPDDPKRRLVAQHGKYSIWYDPLPHRPYGLFRIYDAQRYVGAQISIPCKSDCEWLDHHIGIYAKSSSYDQSPYGDSSSRARGLARSRGRLSKEESIRQLQDALAA